MAGAAHAEDRRCFATSIARSKHPGSGTAGMVPAHSRSNGINKSTRLHADNPLQTYSAGVCPSAKPSIRSCLKTGGVCGRQLVLDAGCAGRSTQAGD